MRRIVRRKLDPGTQWYLDDKSAEVMAAPRRERAARARALWKAAQKTAALKAVKRTLRRMASGLGRCMYCEDSAGATIDHFRPLARYPHLAFRWKNHFHACSFCNSNQKRDQFPVDAARRPLLIKPTLEDPLVHLELEPDTGNFKERDGSPKGAATIRVFGLNARPDLPRGRKNALLVLQGLLRDYAQLRRDGSVGRATEYERVIRNFPFSSVLVHLMELASGPGAAVLEPDCITAIATHPEIRGWL